MFSVDVKYVTLNLNLATSLYRDRHARLVKK